jgi:hypothetical protein
MRRKGMFGKEVKGFYGILGFASLGLQRRGSCHLGQKGKVHKSRLGRRLRVRVEIGRCGVKGVVKLLEATVPHRQGEPPEINKSIESIRLLFGLLALLRFSESRSAKTGQQCHLPIVHAARPSLGEAPIPKDQQPSRPPFPLPNADRIEDLHPLWLCSTGGDCLRSTPSAS